jgi:N-terminal domain of toast_rack, DUF2154
MTKPMIRYIAFLPLLGLTGCHERSADIPPVQTVTRAFERGSAEFVSAEIQMSAGAMVVSGGNTKLLDAEFRSPFPPVATYDVKGARGVLQIRGQRNANFSHHGGDVVWKLRFDNQTPLDLVVRLGAGETNLDLSGVALRSLQVHMGVGELILNLDGEYKRDVDVEVHGGVGRAEIRLPQRMGAQVDATGGIGSVSARGLKKDEDGRYVNRAYEKSVRQVRCKVRGGVGSVELIGDRE